MKLSNLHALGGLVSASALVILLSAAATSYDPWGRRTSPPASNLSMTYVGKFAGDGTGLSNVVASSNSDNAYWTTIGTTLTNKSGKAFVHLTTGMSGAVIAGGYLGYTMTLAHPTDPSLAVYVSGLNGRVIALGGFYGPASGLTNIYSTGIRAITNSTPPNDAASPKVWANLVLTNGAVYKIPLYQ